MPTNPSNREVAQRFLNHVFLDRVDWTDEHHKDTPVRFVKMLRELTAQAEPEFTTFKANTDEMVIVKDIPFSSLCAHHIIPFVGYCHIGYIPGGTIAGLSKFARVVKYLSATLTVQEDLNRDVALYLMNKLQPKGIAVVMEAEHMCMTLRGVQVPGTKTITSSMHGAFSDHNRLARQEFLELIRDRK